MANVTGYVEDCHNAHLERTKHLSVRNLTQNNTNSFTSIHTDPDLIAADIDFKFHRFSLLEKSKEKNSGGGSSSHRNNNNNNTKSSNNNRNNIHQHQKKKDVVVKEKMETSSSASRTESSLMKSTRSDVGRHPSGSIRRNAAAAMMSKPAIKKNSRSKTPLISSTDGHHHHHPTRVPKTEKKNKKQNKDDDDGIDNYGDDSDDDNEKKKAEAKIRARAEQKIQHERVMLRKNLLLLGDELDVACSIISTKEMKLQSLSDYYHRLLTAIKNNNVIDQHHSYHHHQQLVDRIEKILDKNSFSTLHEEENDYDGNEKAKETTAATALMMSDVDVSLIIAKATRLCENLETDGKEDDDAWKAYRSECSSSSSDDGDDGNNINAHHQTIIEDKSSLTSSHRHQQQQETNDEKIQNKPEEEEDAAKNNIHQRQASSFSSLNHHQKPDFRRQRRENEIAAVAASSQQSSSTSSSLRSYMFSSIATFFSDLVRQNLVPVEVEDGLSIITRMSFPYSLLFAPRSRLFRILVVIFYLGTGLAMGGLFLRSGLADPSAVIAATSLQNLLLVKFILSRVGCGLIFNGIIEFVWSDFFNRTRIRWYQISSQRTLVAIGGFCFGLGVALSGIHPFFAMSVIAVGVPHAALYLLGQFVGTLVFIFLEFRYDLTESVPALPHKEIPLFKLLAIRRVIRRLRSDRRAEEDRTNLCEKIGEQDRKMLKSINDRQNEMKKQELDIKKQILLLIKRQRKKKEKRKRMTMDEGEDDEDDEENNNDNEAEDEEQLEDEDQTTEGKNSTSRKNRGRRHHNHHHRHQNPDLVVLAKGLGQELVTTPAEGSVNNDNDQHQTEEITSTAGAENSSNKNTNNNNNKNLAGSSSCNGIPSRPTSVYTKSQNNDYDDLQDDLQEEEMTNQYHQRQQNKKKTKQQRDYYRGSGKFSNQDDDEDENDNENNNSSPETGRKQRRNNRSGKSTTGSHVSSSATTADDEESKSSATTKTNASTKLSAKSSSKHTPSTTVAEEERRNSADEQEHVMTRARDGVESSSAASSTFGAHQRRNDNDDDHDDDDRYSSRKGSSHKNNNCKKIVEATPTTTTVCPNDQFSDLSFSDTSSQRQVKQKLRREKIKQTMQQQREPSAEQNNTMTGMLVTSKKNKNFVDAKFNIRFYKISIPIGMLLLGLAAFLQIAPNFGTPRSNFQKISSVAADGEDLQIPGVITPVVIVGVLHALLAAISRFLLRYSYSLGHIMNHLVVVAFSFLSDLVEKFSSTESKTASNNYSNNNTNKDQPPPQQQNNSVSSTQDHRTHHLTLATKLRQANFEKFVFVVNFIAIGLGTLAMALLDPIPLGTYNPANNQVIDSLFRNAGDPNTWYGIKVCFSGILSGFGVALMGGELSVLEGITELNIRSAFTVFVVAATAVLFGLFASAFTSKV